MLYYLGGFEIIKMFFRQVTGSNGVIVLLYHRVVSESQRNGSAPEMTITPEMFAAQLHYLKKHYNVISIDEFLTDHGGTQKAPNAPPKLLLTFDDGWKDNYLNAFPILSQYKLHALIFLTTDYIGADRIFWPERFTQVLHKIMTGVDVDKTCKNADQLIREALDSTKLKTLRSFCCKENSIDNAAKILIEELKQLPADKREQLIHNLFMLIPETQRPQSRQQVMLNWDEVEIMHKAGITFGAHSCSHALLDRIESREAADELKNSKRAIEKKLACNVLTFAYPNGNYNNEILGITSKAGFKAAFTTKFGINRSATHPLELKRIRIDDNFSRGIKGGFSPSLFEFGIWRHILKLEHGRWI